MTRLVICRRVLDSRQTAFVYQARIGFGPGRHNSSGDRFLSDRLLSDRPMRVGSFVTPLRESRHHSSMDARAAELFHGALALPHRQSPIGSMGVDEQASSAESVCTADLTLGTECHPKKSWKIDECTDAEACDRCQHTKSFYKSHRCSN